MKSRNHIFKLVAPQSSSPFVLAALCFGFSLVTLDTNVLNVTLPTIKREFGGEVSDLQWLVNSYTLVLASLLLTAGILGDRLGTKRVYLAGLGSFAFASAWCSVAPSFTALLVGRVLQGVGAALMAPTSLSLIGHTYPEPKDRAHAVGIWGGASGAAFAGGPVVGGLLVDTWGWRSIFLINIPLGLLALVLTMRFVTETPRKQQHGLDWLGQVLATIGLLMLTYALIETNRYGWNHSLIRASLLAFVVSMSLFIAVESKIRHPMLPLELFANPSFSVASIIGFIFSFGQYGLLFVLSLFLQTQRGYSASATGFFFLPLTLIAALTTLLSGQLTARLGPQRPVLIGLSAAGIGALVILASVRMQVSNTLMGIGLSIFGFGSGMTMPSMTAMMLAAAPKAESGIASAILNASRQTGSVVGVALLGTLLANTFEPGMQVAILVVAVSFLFGAVLVGTLKRR